MKPLPCLYHVSTTAIFVEKEQHGGGVQHRISTAARWLTIKYRRCLLSGAAAMVVWSGQWGGADCLRDVREVRCAKSARVSQSGRRRPATPHRPPRRPSKIKNEGMSWRDSIKCVIVSNSRNQSPKVPYQVAFDCSLHQW